MTRKTNPRTFGHRTNVTSLKSRLWEASFWQRSQPPTVRLCMVEVAEAVASKEQGRVAWLSDFVCFRLYPILHPNVFRKHIHVVPRTQANDVADYAIGLRLFHEG